MAPITFHLLQVYSDSSFLTAIQQLSERPIYLGKTHHWVHAPNLSSNALVGQGLEVTRWDYLLVQRALSYESLAFPEALKPSVLKSWSITTDCAEEALDSYSEAATARKSTPRDPLPSGWSPEDPSKLAAAVPPADLEASLALSAHSLGSSKASTSPIPLKDFIRKFGTEHMGPISMFNLLAYYPEKRPVYFQYVAAFQESVGSNYGAQLQIPGLGVAEWASRIAEGLPTAKEAEAQGDNVLRGWEDVALVWYPSIWHFAKMLDDEEYAKVDRAYKQGALQDNPLLCCTEVEVKYN